MILRIEMVKVPIPGKPSEMELRVLLPTYEMVECDEEAGWAVVIVPDVDVVEGLPHQSSHSRWYDHLDNRYQEHGGRFRPKLV